MPDGDSWILRRESQAWRGTLSDIVARLDSNIRGRMRYRDYLVQRYIASCDTDGRPAAIRVDLMMRPAGGWEVFRIACRITSPTAFVGNLKLGGADGYIEPFLARRSVRNPVELQEEAMALAIGAAETLNANPRTEPNFAYGIDLAIDRDDRLWLIEANGQPQSTRFHHYFAIPAIAYLLSLAA
jgi:glutathione synthase/RimK-type ligase-like ATP-grasp enzyme